MTVKPDPPNQPTQWNPIARLRAKITGQPDRFQASSFESDIQQSIDDLAAEMNGIARGDLTIHAEVKDNITGPIACSINYMVHQLRQIIRVVQDATHQVTGSAQQMRETTERLSRESESQAAQIVDTSLAIDEMVESIREVAENTSRSATVADEARQVAGKGADAVSKTIKGMDRVRSQVQSTSKRIKRLGESSQEIGEIVKLISDVADRTSILALNASIQAAMAGEAGQGFQMVAEEVERLSKRCNDATKQIARLVKSIQSETSEVIASMEETTSEVVEGSKLASQAGDALADIDSVSSRLAELINSISFAAKQQARGGLLVSRSIKEVTSVIHETATATKDTAASVSHLASLAEDLRSSVSRFRLAHDNGSSSATSRGVHHARERGEAHNRPLAFAETGDCAVPEC